MLSNQPQPPLKSQILFREWIAIALVSGLVVLLAIVSWFPQLKLEKEVASYQLARLNQPTIEILVEGAVGQPGIYSFPPGVTVREVLKTIPLLKEANRKEIPYRKVFLSSQTLFIPSKQIPTKRKPKQKNLE